MIIYMSVYTIYWLDIPEIGLVYFCFQFCRKNSKVILQSKHTIVDHQMPLEEATIALAESLGLGCCAVGCNLLGFSCGISE